MDYDIIIVGAGPAGLSFACSLRDSGLKLALVERLDEATLRDPPYDGREIALTHLSARILEGLGAWSGGIGELVVPIMGARVLDGDSDYSLDFDLPDPQLDALGYMVSNHHIRRVLFERASVLPDAELLCERSVTAVRTDAGGGRVTLDDGRTLSARLIVAADSRFSATRRMMGIPARMKDFGRTAIVCRMRHERPHDRVASECFHYGRTLAVLPLAGQESSIVITIPSQLSSAILEMSEAEFNADVATRFGHHLGAMELVSERFAYPLVGVHASRFYAEHFALIGDAAVGMHPVTAHGFNLGLRGQDTLSENIRTALQRGRDIGGREVVEAYDRTHMLATRPLYHGTNGIVGLFTDDRIPARLMRKAVLHFSNVFPPIRRVITNALTEKRKTPFPLPF